MCAAGPSRHDLGSSSSSSGMPRPPSTLRVQEGLTLPGLSPGTASPCTPEAAAFPALAGWVVFACLSLVSWLA